MIPLAPALAVRPLELDDLPAVISLTNRWLGSAIYSLPLDRPAAYDLFVRDIDVSHHGVRYTARCRLGAWRAGELMGFVDIAAGHDADHLGEPEHRPHGLLRFLALTDREPFAEEAFLLLMQDAERFWRNENATSLVGFHVSTGYACFQAGAGILPGDWSSHVRLLTAADWRFSQRYYALARPAGPPLEEACPQADFSLVQQRTADGRTYRIYHRRVEPVARATVIGMHLDRTGTTEKVAHIVDLEVAAEWRNRNVGRWLLRRILNDAALQGFQEALAFVPMSRPIAMNLFIQQGFSDINYRGYTFEKQLAPDLH